MTEQKIYTTSSIPHTNNKQFVLKRTIKMGIYDFSAVGPIGCSCVHCRRYHWSKSCVYTKLKDSNILRWVDGTSFATPAVGVWLTCLSGAYLGGVLWVLEHPLAPRWWIINNYPAERMRMHARTLNVRTFNVNNGVANQYMAALWFGCYLLKFNSNYIKTHQKFRLHEY